MIKIFGLADIDKGKLSLLKEKEFKEAIGNVPKGRYFITLEKVYRKRSLKQNNSLWAIPYKILINCFIDAFGHNVTEAWVHNFCKENLLPEEYLERIKKEWDNDPKNQLINKLSGEIIVLQFEPTTRKMTTVECMEYYENLQNFGCEYFGAEIPEPDKDWKKKLKEYELNNQEK
ncbi:MAG: hypothetical protein M0P71_11930 [Melioribacteraceae bacterium]|jgi:hypothetical protein|nr:hypothetical protein [Melioribacteraceae bacterium]